MLCVMRFVADFPDILSSGSVCNFKIKFDSSDISQRGLKIYDKWRLNK